MSGVFYKRAEDQIIQLVLVGSTVSANDRILYFRKLSSVLPPSPCLDKLLALWLSAEK